MNRILAAAGVICAGLLTGCLNDNSDCNTSQGFSNQEFYLIGLDGKHYLSSTEFALEGLELCDDNLPPANVGFDGIFNVSGAIIGSCEGKGCIRVTEYSDPFCELEFEKVEGDYTLYDSWFIQHLDLDSVIMPPSCLAPSMLMVFVNQGDSLYQAQGYFGLNGLLADFRPISDNIIGITEVEGTDERGPPYLHAFEQTVIQLFEETSRITYSVDGNTMTLEMSGNNEISLFIPVD